MRQKIVERFLSDRFLLNAGASMMRLLGTEPGSRRLRCSVILLCILHHAGAAWGPRTLLDGKIMQASV